MRTLNQSTGRVYIVGAGPGDPGLITRRGLELLGRADVVLYDRLASAELLLSCRPHAIRIAVGKTPGRRSMKQDRIHRLMIGHARRGRTVVRLKGGDPLVFGRGAEELNACRKAGVSASIIPGVSSALAAPAAVGVPVTFRGVSRHFVVVTARDNGSCDHLDFGALAAIDTVVVLMGRARLRKVCQGFLEAGKSPETPAVCVEWATTERQRSVTSRLDELALQVRAAGLRAPVVTVIGEVASFARVKDSVPAFDDVPGFIEDRVVGLGI